MSADQEIIPLFPLNTVLLPGIALPLHIFEQRYKVMISECVASSGRFGVVLIAAGREVGAPATPYRVGTTARIVGVDRFEDGRMNLFCIGDARFRILDLVGGTLYQRARIAYWPDDPDSCDATVIAHQIRCDLRELLALGKDEHDDAISQLPANPFELGNVVAASLPVDLALRQSLLEEPSSCSRLHRIATILREETAMMRVTGAARFIAARPGQFSDN